MWEIEEDKVKTLIRGCQRQDRESQALLYRMFYGYGMSITHRYASNRDEASEILNDGFMKVFKNITKVDMSRPFKPWFRQILVNTAINHYRQKQRAVLTEELDNANGYPDKEQIHSEITYQQIVELLSRLPPTYRTIFNLFAIEGYSHEEIAHMLDITVGTSKSSLSKARDQLKKHLSIFFEVTYV